MFKETKEAIFAAGMNDFVTKPVELRRLHKVLHHWKAQIDQRKAKDSVRFAGAPTVA